MIIKGRRRPDVTADEKAKLLAVCRDIRAEEPELSVRAYMYRIWARQNLYLHGEVCSKVAGPGTDPNEETIQRLILAFRRDGSIPYESITDGTRPTSGGDYGYDDIDEAREDIATHRQRVIDNYTLSIWGPQPKHVEVLSEKQALAPIVERAADTYRVPSTSSKGFSSESMLYQAAKRAVRSGKPTTFLILTDHDRPGYNMAEHVEREVRRLVALICRQLRSPVLELTFKRIGLNAEQVERYEVMTRDPKASEKPHWHNYVAECAEVDALRSTQIEEIVREAIEAELDLDILEATRAQEAADIETLRADEWEDQ
jgi:hypothetical protein